MQDILVDGRSIYTSDVSMEEKMRKTFTLVLGCPLVLGACGANGTSAVISEVVDTSTEEDTTGPVIEHDPIENAQLYGEPVAISAIVTDDESGVFLVKVFYKQETTTTWNNVQLSIVPPDTGIPQDTYAAEIPGAAVGSGGMHYYLWANDLEENESFLPEGGENDPWHFRVTTD